MHPAIGMSDKTKSWGREIAATFVDPTAGTCRCQSGRWKLAPQHHVWAEEELGLVCARAGEMPAPGAPAFGVRNESVILLVGKVTLAFFPACPPVPSEGFVFQTC